MENEGRLTRINKILAENLEDGLMTISEAATHTELSARQLDRMAKLGKLETIRIGRDYITDQEALDKYLASPLRKHGKARAGKRLQGGN